ncbi:flagellar biosynthesis regulator FlaF [Paracoccus sp. (in: a-proteobacteria)]|uniref:flagellar biosynthesis regulator FlaF n=1 Tax=Paracoccus sp. TaxID=267 RepID=UPI0032206155
MGMNVITARMFPGADFFQLRSDRDNEYLAFSRVTRHFQQAVDTADRNQMILAARLNIDLWTALAADLAQPGNGLPDQTRSGLISLAIFSIKSSHRILSEDACPRPLMDINLRVMKGLRGDLGE